MRCFSKLFVLSLFAYSHAKNVPSSRLADTDSHPTIYAIGHNKPVYAEGFLYPAQPRPLGKENHAGKKVLFERDPVTNGIQQPVGIQKAPNNDFTEQGIVQAPSVNHGIDSNSEPPPSREPACSPPSITYMAKRNTNSVLPSVPVCRQISDGQVQWDPSDDLPTLLPPIPTDPPCTQISDGQIQCRTTGQRATYLFEHQAAVATVVDNGNVPQNILYVREAPNVSNSPRVKILGFIWLGVCILLGTVLLMS